MKKHVQILTGEDFAGRRAGTKGEAAACRYLAAQLQQMGIEPAGEKGTFFQTFPIPEMSLGINGKRTVFSKINDKTPNIAENILGVIKGKEYPNQYIVLSAHLDHLGMWKNQLYPGANDNASGVAVLLEIAKLLSEKKDELPYSVLIAFWNAEEMGLLGSRYFVQHSTIPLGAIKLNINLDSIGSGKNNKFIFWAQDQNKLPEWLATSGLEGSKLELEGQMDTTHTSDHRSFLEKNIPAVTFLAENWLENNHTPLDIIGKLNYIKMETIGQFVIDMVFSPELSDLFT